jgi:hypothetical protein
MKKTFTLFFLLTFGTLTLCAQQQILFEQKQNPSFLLRASDFSGDAQAMFQKLAEGQNRPVSSIGLTLIYDQVARVVSNSATRITATVENRNLHISGDGYYRGFDMSEYLVPDQMSFTSTLRLVNGDIQPYSWNDQVKIANDEADRTEHSVADSLHGNWRLDVSQQKFFFRNVSRDFQAQIREIDDYYAASLDLERMHLELQKVNPSDIDRIDFQSEQLGMIEASLQKIETANFDQRLNLAAFDPLHFTTRYNALRSEVFARRAGLDDARRTLYLHYYNAALDLQARGKRQAARSYFEKSLHENPLFAPSAYQLVKMNFEEGNFYDAGEQGSDIMNRMNPDPDIRKLTIDLLHKTYNELINEADALNNRKKYGDALSVLQRASELCRNVDGIPCTDALQYNRSKAINGQYQDILNDARVAYQNGDYDKAERRTGDAYAYREDHLAEIPSADDARDMMNGIRQGKYDHLVDSGRVYLKQKNFEGALEVFDDATGLQTKFQLHENPGLDTLKKKAARPILLSDISKGMDFVAARKPVEARKLTKKIIAMQNAYGLQTDAEINHNFTVLKDKIFSQECENAQHDLDNFYSQMLAAASSHEFIRADNIFKQANKFATANGECNLNSSSLQLLHDSVLPAYVYQSLLYDVITLQDQGKYADAISKYDASDIYYHRYNVARFNLTEDSLADLAIAKGNNDFLLYLGNNFRSRKQYEHSLAMYKTLITRRVSQRYVNDPLYELGMEMARRDMETDPSGDAKQKALAYTGGDSHLKKLVKGYQKGWKVKK